MINEIGFTELSNQLKRFVNKNVTVSYESKNAIHISPMLIECFDFIIYPRNTTFFYDYKSERMRFHKEDVAEINCIDDEDGLALLIAFSDSSYIIVGLEDERDDNN